ncbi:MAG: hypothetical protein LBU37_12200 [Tannerellaceae bacterium]|jgi:hypothetical protein|nr:hypothetical protein [Tannerellaceae bacterium]
MSYTTIYFLSETENLDKAGSRVNAYLEGENFFDYSEIQHDLSGPLETKRAALDAFLNGWNWKESADALLKEAEGYKTNGDLGTYGFKLIMAGELYSQGLTIDTYVFNIDTGDYSIPEESGNWWVIVVDFHY